MTREKQFENLIRDYLNDLDIYHFKFWGGNLRTASGNFVKTKKGVPDLICCINSHFVGLEIKQENGSVSEDQKQNIAEINRNGGLGLIVFPKDFELLKITINELLKGEKDINTIRATYYAISKNL